MKKIYLYGMIIGSNGFLLSDFMKEDEYCEIQKSYRFPGGETGTCATVLSSLGTNVIMDGTHIGRKTASLIKEFYKKRNVNLDSLYFDDDFEGLEDYIIIAKESRTPMGTFGNFFNEASNGGKRHWNKPDEKDIINCDAAAIDPFFFDDSDKAAEYCVKNKVPYVTIDCRYDSYLHRNSSISVISGEGLNNNYPRKNREEMFSLFQESGKGLTIITNGGDEFIYGRKGGDVKKFAPFKVNVISTLGAGDTFKAACTYALAEGMNDDEIVKFASACAAAAISRFPMQLDPPKLSEVMELYNSRN